MSESDRPYTTGEVASFCDVTINAVKKWIAAGKLPAFRTPGGHYRIERDDFKRFVETYKLHIKERLFKGERKILIVDDEVHIVEFIKDVLQSSGEDYAVETARDGYEALIKIGGFNPTLLILDIMMPRLDGFEVCRRIKADNATKDIRIIAVTAYGRDEMEKIKQCGADLCLAKPLTVKELLLSVNRLLG